LLLQGRDEPLQMECCTVRVGGQSVTDMIKTCVQEHSMAGQYGISRGLRNSRWSGMFIRKMQ